MTTTIEEVDLRLTVTKNELVAEDQRLWEGLQNESISRVAGDNANSQLIADVNTANQGTESRLSTEVLHRSEGDLINVNSINALTQALSDYRIKTDLELAAEKLAREQLGVDLDIKISNAVASFDHREHQIYTAIGIVQTDLDGKFSSMDQRISKYEDMLQDITTDSIQITMDSGDINMGAWTILSQAREWDLEILGKFKDYQSIIATDLEQALQDIQNKLPVEQDIIDKAMQGLANSKVISDLDTKLDNTIQSVNDTNLRVDQVKLDTDNGLINMSSALTQEVNAVAQDLNTKLTAEADVRYFEISKESSTRTAQVELLNDGLTQETLDRIEGDNTSIEMINNLKISNDASLANIREELTVTSGKVEANAAQITAIDARVTVAQADASQAITNAASATQKADAAVSATEVMTSQIQTLESNLNGKVDQTAFTVLESKVTEQNGKIDSLLSNTTALQSDVNALNNSVLGQASAINTLEIKQTEQEGKLVQVINDTTLINNELTTVKGSLEQKLDSSVLENIYTKTETDSAIAGGISSFESNLVLGVGYMQLDREGSYLIEEVGTGDITNFDPSTNSYRYVVSSVGVSAQYFSKCFNNTKNIPIGTQYTLSGYVRTSRPGIARSIYCRHNQLTDVNDIYILGVGVEWEYFTTTGVTDTLDQSNNAPNLFGALLTNVQLNDWVEFKNVQLVYGPSDTRMLGIEQAKNTDANAKAIKSTETKVTALDGKVNTLSSDMVNLQASLDQKADASAVSSLFTQVSEIDSRVTSVSGSVLQLETTVNNHTALLTVQGTVINGLEASYVVKTDVDGLVSGYGLYNTGNISAFAVNAQYFYVGKESNGKKPFMVLTSPTTIGGVTYPAGTWIDVAMIANATIGSAHIANASINDAHIVDLNAEKITAGFINADRIGANTISAEKLVIGDTTNLWVNPYFSQSGPRLYSYGGRTQWNGGIAALKSKMGLQLWGRDHIAPYSTRIPLKVGETFVIEYTAGLNAGPYKELGVGLWVYDNNGSEGTRPYQYGSGTVIADLGAGWFRWRRVFQVSDNGSGLPAAFGCLYFQIDQAEYDANPSYYTIGDVLVRRQMGGELIVNGAITADKISVNEVSAISANLGTFTSTVPNKGKTVISGNKIEIFDTSNVRRVFIGVE